MTNRRVVVSAVLLALAPMLSGCAGLSPGMAPSASVTTAIQGWEQWFRLDWAAQARPAGHEIHGYVYNTYGQAAIHMQILAQALDQNGAVVGQKLAWVQGDVPAKSRSYFRVAGLAPAPSYRVSVWAFDFLQGAGDAFN